MKPHSERKSRPADELNHHDAAQGVTSNPQDAGNGGNAPIGGHGQDSRTWTQGGPSHGNPATLGEREKRTTAERESRSKHADGGAAEEQGDAQPATDAQHPAVPPAGKHDKHKPR